jgi:hypothetical protein
VIISRGFRTAVRSPRRGDDTGSAVLEFLALGVVLLMPVMYLALTVGRLQAGAYAADGAARAAARAFVTAPGAGPGTQSSVPAVTQAATERAVAATELALSDQGFDVDPQSVARLRCSAQPCLTPGGRITVDISLPVVLPFVPAVVDRLVPARLTVTSRQVEVVDEFRPVTRQRTSMPSPRPAPKASKR